jgi:hypothetical protein
MLPTSRCRKCAFHKPKALSRSKDALSLFNKEKMVPLKEKTFAIGADLFVSLLMSILWVGFYRYNYNVDFLNSPVVNWFAFFLWSTGLLVTIKTYQWYKSVFTCVWLRVPVLWVSYFLSLLVIEYLGYHIFKIRELTSGNPLCFGLIHGTPTLKVYYLSAGIIAIFLSNVFKKASRKVFSKQN